MCSSWCGSGCELCNRRGLNYMLVEPHRCYFSAPLNLSGISKLAPRRPCLSVILLGVVCDSSPVRGIASMVSESQWCTFPWACAAYSCKCICTLLKMIVHCARMSTVHHVTALTWGAEFKSLQLAFLLRKVIFTHFLGWWCIRFRDRDPTLLSDPTLFYQLMPIICILWYWTASTLRCHVCELTFGSEYRHYRYLKSAKHTALVNKCVPESCTDSGKSNTPLDVHVCAISNEETVWVIKWWLCWQGSYRHALLWWRNSIIEFVFQHILGGWV